MEKNQVVFHDVAAYRGQAARQEEQRGDGADRTFRSSIRRIPIAAAEATLKDKASKIVVEKGQIVKVSKDAKGIVSREVLTKKWTDWIDYWAVDFNFESKREIIRVPVTLRPLDKPRPAASQRARGDLKEVWTGDYIFENEWQSFRTKKRPLAGTDQCLSRMRSGATNWRSRWWTSSATTR